MINVLTDDKRIKTLLDSDQCTAWCEAISDLMDYGIGCAIGMDRDDLERQQLVDTLRSAALLRRTLRGLAENCQVMEIDGSGYTAEKPWDSAQCEDGDDGQGKEGQDD